MLGAHRLLQVEASARRGSVDVFSLDDKGRRREEEEQEEEEEEKKNALVFFHLGVTSLRAKRNPRCHSERERERDGN